MMTLEQIRKRKQHLGLTTAQLSEKTGIPLGTLNKILSGATKRPRPENMESLERVLKAADYSLDPTVPDALMVAEREAAYQAEREPREKQPGEFTIEDYYALPDDRRAELIDGVLYDLDAPTIEHQLLAGSVYIQISNYIKKKKGPCIPLISPVDVKPLEDNKTMVQPDVIVVCDREKISKRVVNGAPDFIMEVVSPSSVVNDYIRKANKYADAGVREYWIADPLENRIIMYDLTGENAPVIRPLSGKAGVAIFNHELMIDLDEHKELMG